MLGNEFGKAIFIVGLVIAGVGLAIWFGPSWLGRLPGDIHYQRGNFSVSFPLVTCLLVSLILTVVMWLFRR